MPPEPLADAGPLAEAAELINEVGNELERGEITQKQALARLTDLRAALEQRQDALMQSNPIPKLAANTKNLGAMQEIADAIDKGALGEAADKMRKLQQRLREGNLTEKEAQAIGKDLEKLAELLKGGNPALADALCQAGLCMSGKNAVAALEALKSAELTLEELAELLDQLDRLAKACRGLGRCCGGQCGGIGAWKPGASDRFGSGMGGPGRGRGGGVGELPDVNAAFKPSMLPGQLTDGSLLLSVEQRAAPEEGAEPSADYIEAAFIQARQQAEQAIEKEEIPRGAREFVRQYFGTMESEPAPTQHAEPDAVE
jgi:hypothetical protein